MQDEAAGLVVALLDPQPGDKILDACAAPGGKGLYAAAKMKAQVPARCLTSQHKTGCLQACMYYWVFMCTHVHACVSPRQQLLLHGNIVLHSHRSSW